MNNQPNTTITVLNLYDGAYRGRVVHVPSISRCRSWGWGYSFTPTNHGMEIEIPKYPDHTGTLAQIERAIESDRVLQANRTTFYATAWFLSGKRILATYDFTMVNNPSEDPRYTHGEDEYGNYSDNYRDLAVYDYAWITPGYPAEWVFVEE